MHSKIKGVLFVILAALMWSIESVLARYSEKNSSSIKTAAFALLFGGLTALVYSLIKKESYKLTKKEWKSIWFIVIFGTAIAQPLYYLALSKTQILNAVLIVHTQPLFIILLGYFIMKEALTKYDYIGGFLSLIAAVFITSGSIKNILGLNIVTYGDIIALAAAIMWALAIFPAKMNLGKVSASVIVALRFCFASIFLLVYLFLFSNLKIDNVYQILIGITIGIGSIFYYEGVKRIKAAQVSFIELLAPFFAAIFGLYIFNESLTLLQIISFPILGIGLWMISKLHPKINSSN